MTWRWPEGRVGLVVASLGTLFLLPLLAACGASPGQGYGGSNSGGSPVSCSAPTLAGNIVHIDLADAGGGMMGGGGMQGPGGGTVGHGSGGMTLRTDRVSVAAGQPVSFVARNLGSLVHELVVLPLSAGTAAGSMAIAGDQKVSESSIRGEASKQCGAGAGSGIGPGTTGWVTVTLPPGAYALVCNIAGHYSAGMWAEFTVI